MLPEHAAPEPSRSSMRGASRNWPSVN